MFEDLANQVPEINEGAKYWFVRTDGGRLYEAFRATSSIALGHQMVTLDFLGDLDEEDDAREAIKEEFKAQYPPTRTAEGRIRDVSGLAASQILRFCKEMKRGDVVIIPSALNERLAIGFVADDEPFEEVLSLKDEKFPGFDKRRRVRWVRGVAGSSINPNLFRLFLNPQAIVDATRYSEWIDPLLYEFFRKGEDFHYIMRVQATEHIPAQTLFRAVTKLFDLAQDFTIEENLDLNFDRVDTRINLNSPGDVEFFRSGIEVLGTLALIVLFINGGGVTIQLGGGRKLSLKTDGLIKRLADFLDRKQNRRVVEEVRSKLSTLKVKTPEQLLELLKVAKK